MTPAPGLFTMWRDTRLVVLVSVLAAIYAATLIPFKPIVLLPGVTEVRPAVVFPVVFSLLFGPPAAWGAALGNTIGDLFGSPGPGTFFGFLGNLLYGYLPYRVWAAWREAPPRLRTAADWAAYVLAAVAAASACALVIAWGIHLLGIYPFPATAAIILVNNLLVALVLGPPFLIAIQPRVARMNLLYADPAGPAAGGPARRGRIIPRAAALAVPLASLAGLAAGYLAWASAGSDAAILGAAAPFVAAVLLAAALI